MTQNRKTVYSLLGVIVFMGAMAWAAVPLYDLFCRVTGYGGTTQVADTESAVVSDRIVTVRFDASTARDMPWEFRPMQREIDVRLGETALVFYEAYNPTDEVVAGTASYNVLPYTAGAYFAKIACFCFTEQVLQPGERVEMTVTFFVAPEILEDDEAYDTQEITLSYTFHVMDITEELAALSGTTE